MTPPRQKPSSVLLRGGGGLLLGALVVTSINGWARGTPTDTRPTLVTPPAPAPAPAVCEPTRGELTIARLQLERANAVIDYSTEYGIPADLSAAIYDIALAEGVAPDLAFLLVKVESNFDPQALSDAGAIGLTQVLPSTARLFEPGLTTPQLYERRTNLRLGFRYLRDLLERYSGGPDSTLRLALLAYNRGPAKVQELLDAGRDPQNGYAASIMKVYRRKGTRSGP